MVNFILMFVFYGLVSLKFTVCGKMARQGKVLVAKPKDLNLILRIHTAKDKNCQAVLCIQADPPVGRTDSSMFFSDLHRGHGIQHTTHHIHN